MEGSRVVGNLEVSRLRKEDAAKEKEKRQRDAARDAKGSRGGQAVVVGWAGGVMQ